MKGIVYKVKSPTRTLKDKVNSINLANQITLIGTIEDNKLNQIIYNFAIKKVQNYIALINTIETLKLKPSPKPSDDMKKTLISLDKKGVEALIKKYNNINNKDEKINLNISLNYLLSYYKTYIEINGLAISESIILRVISQIQNQNNIEGKSGILEEQLKYLMYLLYEVQSNRGINSYKKSRSFLESSLKISEEINKTIITEPIKHRSKSKQKPKQVI